MAHKRTTGKKDGKWEVNKEGGKRASVVADTKKEAVQKGAEIARNSGNSQLHIQKRDGTYQEERTYGGRDPYPPPG